MKRIRINSAAGIHENTSALSGGFIKSIEDLLMSSRIRSYELIMQYVQDFYDWLT